MKNALLAVSVVLAGGIAAQADEVEDILNSALAAYAEGDLRFVLEEPGYAQQLVNDLR